MRTIKKLAAAAAMLAAVSCGQNKTPKVLVLYYSQTSNTKTVAEEIANRIGADIEEIVAVNPYDGDFQATINRCLEERQNGTVTEIQPLKSDISEYDIVFLGYPVWFGTYAPPVITLLSQVDLSGKRVVPFCTFGSGGLDSSVRDLRAAQPGAEVLDGYGVRAARMAAVPREIDNFLKAEGFIEGTYVEPEPFPELHPVSEEEAAIFDAAVEGYAMLHAKATNVASRITTDGTEYLFTAESLPREGDDRTPPPGEMKVYVLVEEGQAPVFTQVIR